MQAAIAIPDDFRRKCMSVPVRARAASDFKTAAFDRSATPPTQQSCGFAQDRTIAEIASDSQVTVTPGNHVCECAVLRTLETAHRQGDAFELGVSLAT